MISECLYLLKDKMRLVTRKSVFGVSTRSDTDRTLQSQTMETGLKCWIKDADCFYLYVCSENIGAASVFEYAKNRFSHNAAQLETSLQSFRL